MRNISPSNRKPSAAGSGFRTEDLWVTCRPPYPLCHSGYPSGSSYYGLGTVGWATTDRVTTMSSIAEVTPKDGKTGSRSLEFKLLSGKTTILMADNRVQVRDVLHKLPGADWLSIGGHRVLHDALIADIPDNLTLTVHARLRGGSRIFMADEA